MEMQVAGPNGELVVTREVYEAMKDRFLSEEWDSSEDFDGADWHFEGRFHFEIWPYEQLTGGAC